jgi:hypothetical protein
MLSTRMIMGSSGLGGYSSASAVFQSPLEFANCVLWYDSSTLILNDLDPVTSFSDSSTSANNATGTSLVYHTNVNNGKPAVYFGGVGSYLSITTAITNVGSWFVVWKRDGSTNNDYVLGNDADGGSYTYLQYGDAWYVAPSISSVIGLATNTMTVRSATYDGVTITQYVDGGSPNAISSGAGINIKTIGTSGFPLQGYIFDVAVFNRSLSSTEIFTISNYFKNKYNF